MRLLHTYPGTGNRAEVTVEDQKGRTVRATSPLYDLGNGIAAIPKAALTDHGYLAFDLNTWHLYDMEDDRDLRIRIAGNPERSEVLRIVESYVRNGRNLSEDERRNWIHDNELGDCTR